MSQAQARVPRNGGRHQLVLVRYRLRCVPRYMVRVEVTVTIGAGTAEPFRRHPVGPMDVLVSRIVDSGTDMILVDMPRPWRARLY